MFATDLDTQIAWERRHLRRTIRQLERLPELVGMRLALNSHIDTKLIPVIEGLQQKGATLHLTTANPATVRDAVVERAQQLGATVTAARDMSEIDWTKSLADALAWEPTHICEMGAALAQAAHGPNSNESIRAGVEITGSGIAVLKALELRFPVLDVDHIPVKTDLHNRHLVGLSTWHTFTERTHLTLHERTVLVVGYGPVAQGVALAARASGGAVVVSDVDPTRQVAAMYDGFAVADLSSAIPDADVIATATGAHHVLGEEHLSSLRDGCVLLNVGHRSDEIDMDALFAWPHHEVLPHVDAVQINESTVFVLAKGAMANLAAGWGDGLNTFDLTLAVIVAGIGALPSLEGRPPAIYDAEAALWAPAVNPP